MIHNGMYLNKKDLEKIIKEKQDENVRKTRFVLIRTND